MYNIIYIYTRTCILVYIYIYMYTLKFFYAFLLPENDQITMACRWSCLDGSDAGRDLGGVVLQETQHRGVLRDGLLSPWCHRYDHQGE